MRAYNCASDPTLINEIGESHVLLATWSLLGWHSLHEPHLPSTFHCPA